MLLAALLAAACATPPPPQPSPAAIPGPGAPAPEISTIVVPIRASLRPLLPLLEAQVPRSFEQTEGYELDPKGRFGIRYRVVRDPIELNMQGSGLHTTVTVRYAIEGCSRTRNPLGRAAVFAPCVSCGFGEPMRQATIALHSQFEWGSDWTLRMRTTARPVEFANRCTVTFAKIDITDWKLAPLVNAQLRETVKVIDRHTTKLASIRPQAQQIWSSLQEPAEIAPKTWLVLEPVDVALAPVRGNALEVDTALELHARTRIVYGARPVTSRRDLPGLRTSAGNRAGLRVPFELEIPYDEASRLLTEQFAGKRYRLAGGASLAIGALRLAPGTGGRLSVDAEIEYRGGGLRSYAGLIHLDGVPLFDAATSTVRADGLDYVIGSRRKNPLTRTAERFAHDEVRKQLRANAVWSIAADVARIRAEIERGMSRRLAANVAMHGRIDSIQPEAVIAGPGTITIRVVAIGAVEVVVE